MSVPHIPKKARNANPDSIRACPLFGEIPVTGLIGVFLKACFRIIDYPVPNSKQGIFRGEKPALLFPFGWQISGSINHTYRLGKRIPFLNISCYTLFTVYIRITR
jgi:hypothetical protein